MFTGIIESIGTISGLEREGSNLHIDVWADFAGELQIDQSVAHNGVCLTVVSIDHNVYRVTAIEETLKKTNLGGLKIGSKVNLERAMTGQQRLDGHMVQGHVDQTATCVKVEDRKGSWNVTFQFDQPPQFLLVNKGSVCVDGVSLTVVDPKESLFSVSIIPYTYEHTLFSEYTKGSVVNIEFDVIGKYVHTYMQHYRNTAAS